MTVKEALALPLFRKIKVVGGRKALGNVIRWVHIGETVDMARWLHGKELLLSCAHGIREERSLQEAFLIGLAQVPVAAVGIEVGYYFEEIPKAMRFLADQLNLPLLQIPHGVPFVDLTEVLFDRIFTGEQYKEGLSSQWLSREYRVFELIKWGQEERALSLLEEIMEDKRLEGSIYTKSYGIEMLLFFARAAMDGGGDEETCLESKERYLQKLSNTTHLQEKKRILKEALKEFTAHVNRRINTHRLLLIDRIREYLQAHYSRKLSLEEIAQRVSLSTSYLSKLFKEETGQTVIEHLTEIRLKKAREILLEEDLPLEKVAQKAGFSDASYFSRVFKREEGLTPGQFKQGKKGNR